MYPAMVGHFLLLIEQIVADADHVHAGLERSQAGLPGAHRLLQSLHLHVVGDQKRIGKPPAQPAEAAADKVIGLSLSHCRTMAWLTSTASPNIFGASE